MAMNYQNFASLGVNLNRQKYGPLDISNVFTSAADLKYYLTKGTFTEGVSEYWYKNANEKIVPYPYEGQVLATVIDGVVEVFVLALDAEGNFETREIAGKIEVDGTTIVKDADGKLSIVAPVDPDSSKTYNFAYANGVYSWVEVDTATAAGQAQAIAGLTDRTVALETTVNGKAAVGEEGAEGYQPAVVGLVEKVAANAQAIADETAAREAAIGKATEGEAAATGVYAAIEAAEARAKAYADAQDDNTIYDDTAVTSRLDVIERDYLKIADKYDDTEVRGLISDLDTVIGDAENGLVKDIADNKAAIEAEVERAAEAERLLGERIDGIDFVDTNELAAALEPINTALGTKAAQSDLETLKGRVDAFFEGTGVENVIDTLEDLINYINTHDDVELSDIIADIEALQTKVDTGDQKVSEYVTAAINALSIGDYAKAADLTDLAGRVSTLEAKPFDTYATKTEVSDVDAKFANYTATTELNTALAGKVNTSDFDTFKGENTTAIGAAKSEAIAAAKLETETQVGALETSVANIYATKAELDTHEEGIAKDLLAYAKTADVNAELAKKIESATIAHVIAADAEAGIEAVPEGITKEGTTLKIVVDAPTRAETTQMIADKVAAVTGGESAAAVKLLVEAEVERSTAKDDAHDAALAILQGDASKAGSVAEAKALAQKGVDDAAKVASDLATANTNIGNNAREIETVKGTITTVNETLSGKITNLENKDIELAGLISGLDTAVKGNATTIGEHTAAITALDAKDTELAGLINGVDAKFANYTNTEGMNKAIDDKIAAIPAIDLSSYAKTADVNSALALKANAEDVYSKTEADAAFMSESEVDARINALIVGADPEGGKAITDIQNLVKYVDENAGEIAALVTASSANTAKLAGIDGTVVAYVEAQLKSVVTPKASAEVTVAEDGTLGLGEVSTDKLVQGTKTLVLYGGDAEVVVE